jgi:hypothetical protein
MATFVMGYVKHLPYIYAEGCPPVPKTRSPAPVVWPQQLALSKVASLDRIKKGDMKIVVPCPRILGAGNNAYPNEFRQKFQR